MVAGTTRTTSAAPPYRFDELIAQLQQLTQMQATFATSMAHVSQRMEALERRTPERSSPEGSTNNTAPNPTPRIKLDVPRFDGTNPHTWIFKISQFFSYHRTPDDERVTVASF
jgi:hypothetical protein